jgi:hypothetical protein
VDVNASGNLAYVVVFSIHGEIGAKVRIPGLGYAASTPLTSENADTVTAESEKRIAKE